MWKKKARPLLKVLLECPGNIPQQLRNPARGELRPESEPRGEPAALCGDLRPLIRAKGRALIKATHVKS